MEALIGSVFLIAIALFIPSVLVWKIYKGLRDDKRARAIAESDPHQAAVIRWLRERR